MRNNKLKISWGRIAKKQNHQKNQLVVLKSQDFESKGLNTLTVLRMEIKKSPSRNTVQVEFAEVDE